MTRRLPLVPTIVVLAAVAAMIGLGVWQLARAREKEALLQRLATARQLPPIAWPTAAPSRSDLPLFRKAEGLCLQPVAAKVIAGRNLRGESGYSHLVDCRTGAEGPGMRVDIGWSRDPAAGARWTGGSVSGTIGPDRERQIRLVADTGQAGLEPSAPPNLSDIPNNHRSYAVQWFLFAASALVIYALALRTRAAKAAE